MFLDTDVTFPKHTPVKVKNCIAGKERQVKWIHERRHRYDFTQCLSLYFNIIPAPNVAVADKNRKD